ncbi:Stp1/IreP family PP2C-type Ser/Thr phosphatase [Psychrobacillus sp. FSL K6-1267]|uniref:Stp1/IreP family PP2C-type Ser/Thr phosphatase n=1 Tax=Psychrobacillus sp. FSL K6-1267 TaxID=2921543 RepID=UPI0030F952ED
MRFVVKTDVGMKRTINEDRVGVFQREDGRVLAVVADGMGGHNAGDVASEMAITEFEKYFHAYNPSVVPEKEWLMYTFQTINQLIAQHSTSNTGCEGMGTTLIAGLFENSKGSKGIIAHIGDSRVYQITENLVQQITRDHSFVNVLLDSGEINEEQAKTHPMKNAIMKAVGTEKTIHPDFFEVEFVANSYFLFCTDGLSNKLSDSFIQSLLYSKKSLQVMGDELVEEANKSGGEDNISLILLTNKDEEV